MFNKETFANRLIMLRKSKNISALFLAQKVGVSKSAISQFENAVNYPHCNTLIKLADYFDVSLDYLVGRSDDPKSR